MFRSLFIKSLKRQRSFTTTSPLSKSILSHEIIQKTPTDNTSQYKSSIFFLHGMLGSRQNLRTFARKVANTYPGTKCVLLDLRAHGDSPSFNEDLQSHTVDDCAQDILTWINEMNIQPNVLWGHSFGGKVVLSMLNSIENTDNLPTSAWVIDSQPGLVDLKGFENNTNVHSVESIINIVSKLNTPFKNKDDVMQQLDAYGIDRGIQTWMTTNVKRVNDTTEYDWKFDIDVIKKLFVDYCNKDMWKYMGKEARKDVDLHLVRGTKNPFWQKETTINQLDLALKDNQRFAVHDVDAGHWLHAEKPKELFDVMVDGGLEKSLHLD